MQVKFEMDEPPCWWSRGLRFICYEGCGRCCRGEPGAVYFSPEEEARIVEWLRDAPDLSDSLRVKDIYDFRRKFVTLQRWEYPSFIERPNGDCIFYDPKTARCKIYPVRPTQCRLFPFWPELLESPEAWEREIQRCPGMNTGPLLSRDEILEWIHKAENWMETD